MNIWHDIAPERITPEHFIAVIEISKGSKKKYELDKETGWLILDRVLYTSTHYPANYGFIPLTLAQDNDPLDVLVMSSEALEPNTLVKCFPIGVLCMTDEERVDEKILAIPTRDPSWNNYEDINELPAHLMRELSHFFETYKYLEHLPTNVDKVYGRQEAIEAISRALVRYRECFDSH